MMGPHPITGDAAGMDKPARLGQRIQLHSRKAGRVTAAEILVDAEPGPGSNSLSDPLRSRAVLHADLP